MANQGSGFWGAFAQGLPYIQIPGYERQQQNLQQMMLMQQQQAEQKRQQQNLQAAFGAYQQASMRPDQLAMPATTGMELEQPSEFIPGQAATPAYGDEQRRAQFAEAAQKFAAAGHLDVAQKIMQPYFEQVRPQSPKEVADLEKLRAETEHSKMKAIGAGIYNQNQRLELSNNLNFFEQRDRVADFFDAHAEQAKTPEMMTRYRGYAMAARASKDGAGLERITENAFGTAALTPLNILIGRGVDPIEAMSQIKSVDTQHEKALIQERGKVAAKNERFGVGIEAASRELYQKPFIELEPWQQRAASEFHADQTHSLKAREIEAMEYAKRMNATLPNEAAKQVGGINNTIEVINETMALVDEKGQLMGRLAQYGGKWKNYVNGDTELSQLLGNLDRIKYLVARSAPDAGAAFTQNEEVMFNNYVPTLGRDPATARRLLGTLRAHMEMARGNLIHAHQTPASQLEESSRQRTRDKSWFNNPQKRRTMGEQVLNDVFGTPQKDEEDDIFLQMMPSLRQ